jgi:drug/metabolite transporter (DMT)-like permease
MPGSPEDLPSLERPLSATGKSPAAVRSGSNPGPGSRFLAEFLLVGVAAVWGWTFVLVKDAVAQYPTMPFLAIRFGIASLAILPFVLFGRKGWSGRFGIHLRSGIVMGVFLSTGYVFQTVGLERTSASNAGFITGLFVVFVPLLQALVLRVRPRLFAWLGVALAVGGLVLLSGGAAQLNLAGDGLVLLCAMAFAAHILATHRYAGHMDVVLLTAVQLVTVAVVTALLSVGLSAFGVIPRLYLPRSVEVIQALLITALLASAAAFFIQTYAQRHAPPTQTAIILTFEPVFAGLFGYLLAGDEWNSVRIVGAALILAAMLVSELGPRLARARQRRRSAEAVTEVPLNQVDTEIRLE